MPLVYQSSVSRGKGGFGCARPFSRCHFRASALNRFGRACRTPALRLTAQSGIAGAPRARACALPLVAPRARRQSRRARKTVGRCKRWAFAGQPSGFSQSLRCIRGLSPSDEPNRFGKRLGFCLPQVTTPHHHGFSLFPSIGAGGFAHLQPPTTRINDSQKTGASPQFSEPFPHPRPTLSKVVWFASWLTPSREPKGQITDTYRTKTAKAHGTDSGSAFQTTTKRKGKGKREKRKPPSRHPERKPPTRTWVLGWRLKRWRAGCQGVPLQLLGYNGRVNTL